MLLWPFGFESLVKLYLLGVYKAIHKHHDNFVLRYCKISFSLHDKT